MRAKGKANGAKAAAVEGAKMKYLRAKFTAADGTEYEVTAGDADDLLAEVDALRAKVAPNDAGQPQELPAR